MKNLAIIPARGGSKRIPRKNVKDFLGKPIISYSIEAALKSELFDEVMVSTDDQEIAAVATKHGASVPFFRTKENADDYATTTDVLLEVIEKFGKDSFEYACCIYPTAPFISNGVLEDTYNLLVKNGFDTVFPVVKFGYPIQRSLKTNGEKIQMVWPEYLNSRSQDLELRYHDAGQFYWFSVKEFQVTHKLFTKNSGFYEIDELRVQDIDSEIDWKLAELKFKLLNKRA